MSQPRVLDGIRVLDVASWIAGPAAATVMSDFGAEVIHGSPRSAQELKLMAGCGVSLLVCY